MTDFERENNPPWAYWVGPGIDHPALRRLSEGRVPLDLPRVIPKVYSSSLI
jgi:hypothetical protein